MALNFTAHQIIRNTGVGYPCGNTSTELFHSSVASNYKEFIVYKVTLHSSLKMVREEAVSKSCDVYLYSIVLHEILDLMQQVPFSDARAYEIASYLGSFLIGR